MNDDELREFANQFIDSWQANFAKLATDSELLQLLMNNYAKSATAAAANPFKPGLEPAGLAELNRRVDELEWRLADFEAGGGNPERGGK